MALDKAKIEELLAKDLFKELNLEGVSYEERMGLLDEMGRTVIEGVWLRALQNLSTNDQDELAKLVDETDDPEAIMNFLNTKIPNFSDLAKEEIANYKSIILGV